MSAATAAAQLWSVEDQTNRARQGRAIQDALGPATGNKHHPKFVDDPRGAVVRDRAGKFTKRTTPPKKTRSATRDRLLREGEES